MREMESWVLVKPNITVYKPPSGFMCIICVWLIFYSWKLPHRESKPETCSGPGKCLNLWAYRFSILCHITHTSLDIFVHCWCDGNVGNAITDAYLVLWWIKLMNFYPTGHLSNLFSEIPNTKVLNHRYCWHSENESEGKRTNNIKYWRKIRKQNCLPCNQTILPCTGPIRP